MRLEKQLATLDERAEASQKDLKVKQEAVQGQWDQALPVTWRTDDPCPVCSISLDATDDGTGPVTQYCGPCDWSVTWESAGPIDALILSAESDAVMDAQPALAA